jgi:4-amino-4-deoxy-L-arabinose transferase-like glycosyltransferase
MSSSAIPENPAKSRIGLILLCLCLWLPGFFTLPPTDRDESRFAQATKQMLETGDYVRIMNGTTPRNRKPIGIYWAQVPFAAAARALGIARANPIWPYRIPSLLGALLAVLAVAEGGALLVGRKRAFTAAAWFASCLLLVSEAHIAKTDAALVGVTTVAMLLLARAFLTPERTTRAQAAWFWVALAAGILLKGPITPMVAGLTIVCLGFWTRSWSWLRALRPISGAVILLLLVLPWLIAIELATKGAFLSQSVGGDLAGKLSGSDDAHGMPFGTYLALLPLLAFPAAIPLLRGLPGLWQQRNSDEGKFLIAWLLPAWLVFEIVHTKLPHYTLPIYPALFLLAARADTAALPRWGRALTMGLALLAGIALACTVLAAPWLLHGVWWSGVPAALAILAACVLMATGRQNGAIWAMPFVMFALLQIELPRVPALSVSSRVNAALIADGLSNAPLASTGYNEPSLMFLAGTNTASFHNGATLAVWLRQTPGGVALVESRELPGFLQADPGAVKRNEVDGYDYSNGKWVKLAVYR